MLVDRAMLPPPGMAAAILTPEKVTLHNIPYVRDIITQRRLLEDIGATVLTPELRTHQISAAHIEIFEAPYELVKTIRCCYTFFLCTSVRRNLSSIAFMPPDSKMYLILISTFWEEVGTSEVLIISHD